MTQNLSQGVVACLNCGAQMGTGARFCRVCGQPLSATQAGSGTSPVAPTPAPIAPTPAPIAPTPAPAATTAFHATLQPVFVSYSSEDHTVAEKVCRLLELEGISCWVAPRDVRPGRSYGEQIIGAIESAAALVLILSKNANASIFVPKEVERAVSKGKTAFVLRIEQVQPSPALELFVSHGQWIDAWTPPLKVHINALATAIRGLLALPPVPEATPQPRSRPLSRRPMVGLGLAGLGLAALATVSLVGGLLPFASRSPGPTTGRDVATSTSSSHATAATAASPIAASTPQPTAMQPGVAFTGSMAVARGWHTATLLSNGFVLIAGGTDSAAAFSSAELYDPASGTFSATGSMTHARHSHTATLLSDGRVLIAGGWDIVQPLASAELYDPTTGTFSATGTLTKARFFHSATELSDGRVLIAGGWDGLKPLDSAELYDPKTGTFSSTGSMAQARYVQTATLLSDGRVLIAGGRGTSAALASDELYDPKTGTFSPTGSMAQGRFSHTATLLADGRVLLAGGAYDASGSSRASGELYDPTTGKFSSTGSLAQGRAFQTATLLADGRVLIAGGEAIVSGRNSALASAESYDPTTGIFTPAGSMIAARTKHTATSLADGRILIAGGSDSSAALASTELYQP